MHWLYVSIFLFNIHCFGLVSASYMPLVAGFLQEHITCMNTCCLLWPLPHTCAAFHIYASMALSVYCRYMYLLSTFILLYEYVILTCMLMMASASCLKWFLYWLQRLSCPFTLSSWLTWLLWWCSPRWFTYNSSSSYLI